MSQYIIEDNMHISMHWISVACGKLLVGSAGKDRVGRCEAAVWMTFEITRLHPLPCIQL